VGVRRLHDTGRSGWWLLIGLIPFVGWIILLVFFVQDSQSGQPARARHPKGPSARAMVPATKRDATRAAAILEFQAHIDHPATGNAFQCEELKPVDALLGTTYFFCCGGEGS
jgi:hypothetical protein